MLNLLMCMRMYCGCLETDVAASQRYAYYETSVSDLVFVGDNVESRCRSSFGFRNGGFVSMGPDQLSQFDVWIRNFLVYLLCFVCCDLLVSCDWKGL